VVHQVGRLAFKVADLLVVVVARVVVALTVGCAALQLKWPEVDFIHHLRAKRRRSGEMVPVVEGRDEYPLLAFNALPPPLRWAVGEVAVRLPLRHPPWEPRECEMLPCAQAKLLALWMHTEMELATRAAWLELQARPDIVVPWMQLWMALWAVLPQWRFTLDRRELPVLWSHWGSMGTHSLLRSVPRLKTTSTVQFSDMARTVLDRFGWWKWVGQGELYVARWRGGGDPI